MKRVLVIGPSGAGKSTFARALRDRTGLPLIYLDLLWVETEEDPEFTAWIKNFPLDTLPETCELLEKYREGREIYVFRSREDADMWLKGAFL